MSHPPQNPPRSAIRSVAIPTEHGGWGLTAEPVLLGLLLAPSVAGALLGAAAMVAFLVRQPLRLVLVDHHRRRTLARTQLARMVVLIEAGALGALLAAAVPLARSPFWWPALAAAPLVATELWFDMRSRSRRLVPELAGAIGVAAAAPTIVLAGGGSTAEAVGAWLILAARSATAIPFVRSQIARQRGRDQRSSALLGADLAALSLVVVAVLVKPMFVAGAAAVAIAIVFQRGTAQSSAPPKVLGIRQTVLGLSVVAATALGVHLA
ncbi:MAG: YwiC-like family protein [Acidimicrobiales bacterium]